MDPARRNGPYLLGTGNRPPRDRERDSSKTNLNIQNVAPVNAKKIRGLAGAAEVLTGNAALGQGSVHEARARIEHAKDKAKTVASGIFGPPEIHVTLAVS